MSRAFSRISLKALTFVVFAYDRGEKTLRLLKHLDRLACDYQVLIFDNGHEPILEQLKGSGTLFSHYEYKAGDFVKQHYRAAELVNSDYVMLLDDDCIPAVNGIGAALSHLQQSPTYCAVHGSTGLFCGHDLVRIDLLSREMFEDVSRLETNPIDRMWHLYNNFYSRYWNAVRPTSDFQRVICGVAEARGHSPCPDIPEVVLETYTVLQGRTKDIGAVTLWKDMELPTVITKLNPSAPSPFDFWRTKRYKSARDYFFRWYGQYFGYSDIIIQQLRSSLHDYSLSFSNSIFTTDMQALLRRIRIESARLLRSSLLAIESSHQHQKDLMAILEASYDSVRSDLKDLSVTLGGLHNPVELAQEVSVMSSDSKQNNSLHI